MKDIKMIDTWEQKRLKGNQIVEAIILQAGYFEMKNSIKPTIFMSYDLFALVAAASRDLLVYTLDKNQTVHTICGYALEIIHPGTNLLYVGYKIDISILEVE